MISQISAIPEPMHPSYRQFIRRLVRFLQNEQRIMFLVNRIIRSEKFMQLIDQEGFDNESGNELMEIVQNNLLENFADDSVAELENSYSRSRSRSESNETIENMDDSYSRDPLMTIIMYIVIGFALYLAYKHFNKL